MYTNIIYQYIVLTHTFFSSGGVDKMSSRLIHSLTLSLWTNRYTSLGLHSESKWEELTHVFQIEMLRAVDSLGGE